MWRSDDAMAQVARHPQNPIAVIPARMASVRLPGKLLADIHGAPMIVHVWRRAIAANFSRVVVACADGEIVDAVRAVGGEAVETDPDLPSGTDRVQAAVAALDPAGDHGIVVNVQGDLPTVSPATLSAVLTALDDPAVDIASVAAPISSRDERDDPHVVKVALEMAPDARIGRALYFSRSPIPSGDGPTYHHIGVYAFRRTALDRFVALPQGLLEQRERLEQLRALAHGFRIDVAIVDETPIGVDTPADLKRARAAIAPPDAAPGAPPDAPPPTTPDAAG